MRGPFDVFYNFTLYLLVLSFFFSFSCQEPEGDNDRVLVITPPTDMGSNEVDMSSSENSDQSMPVMVEGIELSLRAINPLSNQGVAGLTANLVLDGSSDAMDNMAITDSTGTVKFNVEERINYEITLEGDDYVTHHLFGEIGDQPAEQISFVSTQSLTQQVLSSLGLTSDPNKGIVVIGLDRPNLAPAIGTSVDLDTEYDKAFILGSFGPSEGNEIISGGGGFVSFANVLPGQVNVLVQPQAGENCTVFPRNESAEYVIPIYAGEVSIVAFICQ